MKQLKLFYKVLTILLIFGKISVAQNHVFYVYKNKTGENNAANSKLIGTTNAYMMAYGYFVEDGNDSIKCKMLPLFFSSSAKKNNALKQKTIMSKIEYQSIINDIDIETLSNEEFKFLTDSLEHEKEEYKKDALMVATLDSIEADVKNIYTSTKFLTKRGKPVSFCIGHSKNFNIDSINNYLTGNTSISTFQNVVLQNFNEATTISAELGSFQFGLIRLGVAANFTAITDTNKNNEIKKNIQKIVSNGGVFVFNFQLPLFLTRDKNDRRHFGIFAQSNFGINPGFDSTSKRTDYSSNILFNNQTGFNLHADFASNDKKARLFFDIPFYYTWGSKQLYKDLGVTDYSIVKAQMGVSIADKFSFTISGPLLSSSNFIQGTPFIMSLNFSPSNL